MRQNASESSTPGKLDMTAHAVRTLCLYSIAEFQAGHATTLHVSALGHGFSVGDNGRGHAVDRDVGRTPYLQFIYTQLDYPFGVAAGGPVQLQGIGMSLLNALCSELTVSVKKKDKTLRLNYQAGRLCDQECVETSAQSTGTTVSGTVNPTLQAGPTDAAEIESWLNCVLAAHPAMTLFFNGKALAASES